MSGASFLAMMEVEGWADTAASPYIHRRSGLKPRRPQYLRDRIDAVRPDREALLRRTKDHHCHHHVGLFFHPVRLVERRARRVASTSRTQARILSGKHGEVSLEPHQSDVFLYHLRLLSCWSKLGKRKRSAHTTLPFSVSCWRACRRSSVSVGSAMHSNASASRMRIRSLES